MDSLQLPKDPKHCMRSHQPGHARHLDKQLGETQLALPLGLQLLPTIPGSSVRQSVVYIAEFAGNLQEDIDLTSGKDLKL